MQKRFLSLLLCMSMFFGLMPVMTSAEKSEDAAQSSAVQTETPDIKVMADEGTELYEARYNGTLYETLAEAVEKANEDNTTLNVPSVWAEVTVLRDVTADKAIEIYGRGYTINLDGYEVSGAIAGGVFKVVSKDGSSPIVRIKNGTIRNTLRASSEDEKPVAVIVESTSGYFSDITLIGGTVQTDSSAPVTRYHALESGIYGTAYIENGNYIGGLKTGKAWGSITSGHFSCGADEENGITGNKFSILVTDQNKKYPKISNSLTGDKKFIVKEGTDGTQPGDFISAKTDMITEDCKIIEHTHGIVGSSCVCGAEYVANVKTSRNTWSSHVYLKDAIDAALKNPGSTLMLLKDIDVDDEYIQMMSTLPTSYCTIDLQGHTITGSPEQNSTALINLRGNVTIKNGTVTRVPLNSTDGTVIAFQEGNYTLENLTVNAAVSPFSNRVSLAMYIGQYSSNSNVNINKCDIHGCVTVGEAGSADISDSTILRELTVDGVTYTSYDALYINNCNKIKPSDLLAQDNIYYNADGTKILTDADAKISGNTMTYQESVRIMRCVHDIDADNVCKICGKSTAAKIVRTDGTEYFMSVEGAAAKAAEGDTVVLFKDEALGKDFVPSNSFTFQTENDAKLTFADGYSMKLNEGVTVNADNGYIGSITLEGGSLTEGKNAVIGTLAVKGGSAQLSGTIEKLRIDEKSGIKAADLIDSENYAYKYTDKETWAQNGDATELDNVAVREIPVKNIVITPKNTEVQYGKLFRFRIDYDLAEGYTTNDFNVYAAELEPWELVGYYEDPTHHEIMYKTLKCGERTAKLRITVDGYELYPTVPFTCVPRDFNTDSDIEVTIDDNLEYNGENQTAAVKITDGGIYNYPGKEDITGQFEIIGNVQKNAGTYTVTIRGNGNYKGERTVNFTINKRTPTMREDLLKGYPNNPKEYDGTPKSYSASLEGKACIIRYWQKLPGAGDYTEISDPPLLPGDYKVTIDIPEDVAAPNYNAVSDLLFQEFTMVKGEAPYKMLNNLNSEYDYEDEFELGIGFTPYFQGDMPTGSVTMKLIDENNTAAFEKEFPIDAQGKVKVTSEGMNAGRYDMQLWYSGDEKYSAADNFYHTPITVTKTPVRLGISNTEYRYAPDTERKISVETGTKYLNTETGLNVSYYLVDENSGRLASAVPVTRAVSAGRYMYVISLSADAAKNYELADMYYQGSGTDIPDFNRYSNVGFMDIKASSEFSQQPIAFAEGNVALKVGESYKNTLINDNASVVTYKSSNAQVASVNDAGEVTANKSGTATITATSTMDGATPVYASYTVTVKKEITAASFDLTAHDKVYDGLASAKVTAKLTDTVDADDIVTAEIAAAFADANAGADKDVSFEITGISGINADKYVLTDDAAKLRGTLKASIEKAAVTFICAKTTTRTYDGNAQTVDVSAMANGAVFDSSNYAVKYNGADEAKDVGEYDVTIELAPSAALNYEIKAQPNVKLIITNASQEVFSIEDVPETVYYGNKFKVSASGADGDVSYEITAGGDIASIDKTSGDVTVTGVGKVTVTAVSRKTGYADRTARRTFEVKKRILMPSAAVKYAGGARMYDGKNDVDVEITLDGVLPGDTVTASAKGSMINADAGSGKIVYVSGITLSDNKNYTLGTQSLQTTVDVAPIEITGFTVTSADKVYDGTADAQATADNPEGVLAADKAQVTLVGTAKFASADAGKHSVTFTASGLSGAKAANYKLSCTSAQTEDEYEITPMKVSFTVGQTAFVYDGSDKQLAVSASDEAGRFFRGYGIKYYAVTENGKTPLADGEYPNGAGEYSAEITADSANYEISGASEFDIRIEKAAQNQLVIDGLPGTVEYGDSFELTAFGGADGGRYEWTVVSGNAQLSSNDAEKTTVTVSGTGKTVIRAARISDNYKSTEASVTFTAAPKNVTFDIGNLEQTYGNIRAVDVTASENTAYEITYNGSTELPENAGRYKVKVKTTDSNYRGSAQDTLVINKAQASGSIDVNASYVYGDTVSASANIENGEQAEITYAGTGIYVPRREAPTNAGSYTAIATISGANYETATVTKNFTIEKATLNVWAENVTRAYGEANPVFTLVYEGFVGSDDKNVLLYEPTATAAANASSPVGKYNITVSGGSAENYKFNYVDTTNDDTRGKLTVEGSDGTLRIEGAVNPVYAGQQFTLRAYYNGAVADVTWSADSDIIEIDANGNVKALREGTVTITATAGANYKNSTAEFTLTVKKATTMLTAVDLVKTYNGGVQGITLKSSDAEFVPEIGRNVNVTYVLNSDSSVTEPKQAGVYSVTYEITDPSYSGGGNATLYINKANVTVKPKDIEKEYGKDPEYKLEKGSDLITDGELDELLRTTEFTSEGAARTAGVGSYEITAALGTAESKNLKFAIDGTATMTVTKAPLVIKVKDVTREFGEENPPLETEDIEFKNNDTEDVFTGELTLEYDSRITAETPVGPYPGAATASGVSAENYDITFIPGDVNITKIAVLPSAGISVPTYLAVHFDKAVAGLAAANFTVTNGETPVTLTNVTASPDNKNYTLSGSFTAGTAYTVTISLTGTAADATHMLTNNTLTVTPAAPSYSGGGGGSSSALTVSFDTNGGEKINSVKVTRNDTVDEPKTPVREGYDFIGWFTDKDLTVKYDFAAKVTKNITLYAGWTEKAADETLNQIILTIDSIYASVFGETKNNDVAPIIVNSRTMLPARFVAENLGASVLWDGDKKIVTVIGKNLKTDEDVTLVITIGAQTAVLNGKNVELDSPAFIENDRTYTPIRLVAESLGADVSWDGELERVIITKPQKSM